MLYRLIEACLSSKGKDPELYVHEILKEEALKKRKKDKGIHDSSHIIEDSVQSSGDTEEEANDNENVATQSEYIPPVSLNEIPAFTPRRMLPDDGLPRYPGSGPLPPGATPVNPTTPPPAPEATSTSPRSPVSTNHFDEPILSQEDFQLLWSSREFKSPPPFLTDIYEPLHPGWKSLENLADGACLFRTAADHVWLKDYKLLRKFVHQHIIDDWFFYGSFYVFPISIQIGAGNGSYRKVIENETRYLKFLKSEESMISFNTSNTEIIAIGNILKVNIHVLTYNIQGRVGGTN